ncbi:MAG TPA: Mur ligase family protein [Chitinophagales bacterium]|nr:Mur ligase family protein [Chitinophagales bacterium]
MRIHFIAIGGSIMHNLAIALKQKGYQITGSDDEIFDPALSKLKKYALLPETMGWDAENITPELDCVILGMHAHADNPELAKAKSLNIPIYSFPEFIYEQSKNKKRVVIGGSHGKTTTTAMIMHVLKSLGKDFDFMVGAQLQGFELTVRLSDAPVIILEGDEYPDSAINKTPKLHLYQADIGVITGIAWDHINIFPTFESYVESFKIFSGNIPADGALIYNQEDDEVMRMVSTLNIKATQVPYVTPPYTTKDGKIIVRHQGVDYEMSVFGKHNLQNMKAAYFVCLELGVRDAQFFTAIQSFTGAAKRLEHVATVGTTVIYKDFAHSPSKLKATVNAVKELYPERKLTACLELHTYSSLNKDFIKEYHESMTQADDRAVFYSPHAVEMKRMEPIDPHSLKDAFGDKELNVFTEQKQLTDYLKKTNWQNRNLLMMSSGTFDGLDYTGLATFVSAH